MQWFQHFFKPKTHCQGIVGLSFLAHGMSIAVSNYAENNRLILFHCEFIETKKNEDHLSVLKKWATAYNLSNYDCYLVLDINDYRRINIETPTVPSDEIALAVRWKINELIDFPVEDAIIDYYPLPIFSESRSMLEVIASQHRTLNALIKQCAAADLNLQVIDIQETSLRNLAVLLPKNQQGVAVLYLQKSFGMILIQKEGVIYLARKISLGYDRLELENQFSAKEFVSATYDTLVTEIQRSLDYVESYYGMGYTTELAVIPWGKTTQDLVNQFNNDAGITAYLMDLSLFLECAMVLDYATQSMCAPVIGATLRKTLVST